MEGVETSNLINYSQRVILKNITFKNYNKVLNMTILLHSGKLCLVGSQKRLQKVKSRWFKIEDCRAEACDNGFIYDWEI